MREHNPSGQLAGLGDTDEQPLPADTEAEEGVDDDSLMGALADLPVPAPESPESLIGSTAATKDPVVSTPASSAHLPAGPAPDDASVHAQGPASEQTVRLSPVTPDSDQVDGEMSGTEPGSSESPDAAGFPAGYSLGDLDELTIVARAQDGDPQAFDWLISAYQGGVYRLCFRMLNDRSDAEDVVQETFIAAWRSLPKLTVPQAFIPWLYRTATNKCLDDLRRRKRRPADPTSDADLEGQAARSGAVQGSTSASTERNTVGTRQPSDPAQEVENQAQMRALADLLQTVPAGPRACWLLREVHEFSYTEIAAIVQVPESTVRGRIARAKRSLAEGMEPWR